MKKFSKNMKFLAIASFLTGAPLLSTVSCKAEEYTSETAQDHKVLVGAISEFADFGNAFESFTKSFFGEIPNKFTKSQFINLAHQLLGKVRGIKERMVKYRDAVTGEDSKRILTELEKLAAVLAQSQENLHTVLHRSLGTKKLVPDLNQLAAREAKQVPQIYALQKTINSLLSAHSEKQLKQTFDNFVNSVEYSLTYPEKNKAKVIAITLRYTNLK